MFRFSLFFILFLPLSVLANVSGYAPINLNPLLERHIDALMLVSNQTSIIKPIAINNIQNAFNQTCKKGLFYSFCQPIGGWLNKRKNSNVAVNGSFELRATDGDTSVSLANQRGVNKDSSYISDITTSWQPNDYLAVNLGGLFWYENNNSEYSFENTFISMGQDWAQLDIGYKGNWLSPFKNSAMILSTNAPSIASISLSNSAPLTSLNFKYNFFVGELSSSERIFYNGEFITGQPLLTGVHLSIKPFDGFTLGVNRLLQSGGGDRGGRDLSDFLNAFFDPSGADNINSDLTTDEQFGNQTASFIARIDVAEQTPFSVYMEYAGEDTSDATSWRLGNAALSIGFDIPILFERFSLNVEWSDWQNSWYVHSVYKDGLTNEGYIIGHWAAAERLSNSSIAGDGVGSTVINLDLGYTSHQDIRYQFKYKQIDNQNYNDSTTYSTSKELSVDVYMQLYNQDTKLSVTHRTSVFNRSYTGLSIGVYF